MVANFKKNKKPRSSKDVVFWVVLGAFLVAGIVFLAITNIKINQRRAELTARAEYLKKEIETLQGKKKELEEKVSQGASPEYIEKVAREQLGYKLPGEEVVVISKEGSQEATPAPKAQNLMNIRGWWDWLKSKF